MVSDDTVLHAGIMVSDDTVLHARVRSRVPFMVMGSVYVVVGKIRASGRVRINED